MRRSSSGFQIESAHETPSLVGLNTGKVAKMIHLYMIGREIYVIEGGTGLWHPFLVYNMSWLGVPISQCGKFILACLGKPILYTGKLVLVYLHV